MSAEWMDRAQCLGLDMCPDEASGQDVAALEAVCIGCPVRLECARLRDDQLGAYGVWAGRWCGEAPRDPVRPVCGWCGEPMEAERSTAVFCSGRCRVAAHRARQQSA